MNIVVTGHTGFIGRELVRELVRDNNVLGISKSRSSSLIRSINHDISMGVDIEVVEEIKRLLGKPDVIVHLAAYVPRARSCRRDDYSKSLQVNVHGTLNVLALAKKLRVGNVVLASTKSVYGDTSRQSEDSVPAPKTYYGKSKLIAENLCENFSKEYGVKITALRIASVYGLGMPCTLILALFLSKAFRNEPITVYRHVGGFEYLNLVYVKDVVSAIIKSIKRERGDLFEIVNIGSRRHVNTLELARIVVGLVGSETTINIVETSKIVPKRFLDVGRAREVLNWEPRYDLEEALEEIIPRWYCERVTCK